MLKTFLNKIIIGILPLMHENKFTIELKKNSEILNNFLMKQLSTVIFLQLLKLGSSRAHVNVIVCMHMMKIYDTPIY